MSISHHTHYFLPKKNIIFPCPGFPAAFFGLPADDATDDDGFGFGAATGSSSEKDSHAGSSFVTLAA